MKSVLLCTDLDRTIISNGRQLVEDAINEYALPAPDYLIGDVGTTLYHRVQEAWTLD